MKPLTKAQLEKFLTIPSEEPVLSETQIAKALSNNETVGWKFDENADFKTNFYGFEHLLLRPPSRMEIGAYYLLHKYGKEAFVMFHQWRCENYFDKPMSVAIDFHPPSALDLFLSNIPRYRKPYHELAKKFPFFVLSKLLENNPSKKTEQAKFLLELLAKHPQWEAPLRDNIDENQLKVLDRLTIKNDELTIADTSELPHWLTRVQPWENQVKKTKLVYPGLTIEPLDTEPVFNWSTEMVEENIQNQKKSDSEIQHLFDYYRYSTYFDIPDIQSSEGKQYIEDWGTLEKTLWLSGIKAEFVRTIATDSKNLTESMFRPLIGGENRANYLFNLPSETALAIINKISPIELGGSYSLRIWLLHRLGKQVLKTLNGIELNESTFNYVFKILGYYQFAPKIAQGYCNRWQKERAEKWLTMYPKQAIHGLLPVAFDSKHKNYRHAQRALLFLLTHLVSTYRTIAEQEVAKYPKDVQEAVQFLLENPPLDNSLDKAPTLPQNLHIPSLPPLILRQTGNAIPQDYIKPLLQLFTPTKVEQPSQAVTDIKDIVTEQSLATFALELYHWYESQGRPSKYRWMYALQGHVGNDETARVLATACKRYRQELNRIGAYDAITMLSQIGTDSAIMYLNSFDEQKRYGDLAYRGAVALSSIAKNRGLTREELADRTVPDLGLDFSGKLTLDFGARQFTVSFNEQLQPQISDETGKRLKSLPKPNSKDDTAKASEATKRFSELKKQLKSVASLQVKRLEMAMCNQRRWLLSDFEKFFMHHPFMRHLAQRVAWGIFDEQNQLISLCRVTEELTLTDSQDNDIDMASLIEQGYQIGVVHRLELSEEQLAEFSQLLQDYEIIQPFEQLNRQTYLYLPNDTTDNDHALSEWTGKKITVASLMGLQERGWLREIGDGGMIYMFNKAIFSNGNDYTVTLQIDEGWYVQGGVDTSQVCTIEGVTIYGTGFAKLDKITYSELQRDLHLLYWRGLSKLNKTF